MRSSPRSRARIPADPPVHLNYLAHLFLAERSPEALLGSLLGDFMRGVELSELPPACQAAVWQHREVDRYTDGHAVVQRSRRRMQARFARYSGVMVDLFYDHYLARDWRRYSEGEALHDFAGRVYGILEEQHELLPQRLRRIAPRMKADDWLSAYGKVANIKRALAGMSRRLRRENPLAEGTVELEQNYEALGADFEEFFPQLQAHIADGRPIVS